MRMPPERLKLSRYSGSGRTWSLGGSGKNALLRRSFNHCSKLAATTLTLSGPFISPCCIGFLPVAAIEPPNVGSEDYLIPGTETLELHHLYRAMAFLGQEIESKGQKTLGSPRCLKDLTPGRALPSVDAICLPKSTCSLSIPLRSTLKAVAESQSVNAVTIKITRPIFTRWSSAWLWTSRAARFAARCGRVTQPMSKRS